MSPNNIANQQVETRFPRVSGYEPPSGDLYLTKAEFSPRERG